MADGLPALIVVDMQFYQARPSVITRLQEDGSADPTPYYLRQISEVAEPNILRLLSAFRERGAPVAFTRLATQERDASDLPPALRAQNRAAVERFGHPLIPHFEVPESRLLETLSERPDELVIVKATSGSFARTPLEEWLRSRGATQIVLSGVFTNLCIDSTARAGFDLGFEVTVAADACAALSPELHANALASLGMIYAKIMSTNDVVSAFSS